MAKANVFNMAGQQVGEIELSEAVFGVEPNQAVVHEVVKNHLANCRQGTQSALTVPRSPAAARSPGVRRAPAMPARVPPVLPSGLTAASCSPPSPGITATL